MAAQVLPDMPAGPLLELHGQRKRFHLPQGLTALLEECSREVRIALVVNSLKRWLINKAWGSDGHDEPLTNT
jgi:hypothetical protein